MLGNECNTEYTLMTMKNVSSAPRELTLLRKTDQQIYNYKWWCRPSGQMSRVQRQEQTLEVSVFHYIAWSGKVSLRRRFLIRNPKDDQKPVTWMNQTETRSCEHTPRGKEFIELRNCRVTDRTDWKMLETAERNIHWDCGVGRAHTIKGLPGYHKDFGFIGSALGSYREVLSRRWCDPIYK